MPFPDQLAAGVTQIAGEDPFHLFAGDSKTVTGQGEFGADAPIFCVLGRQTADQKYYPHDPDATDGTEVAVAINAQPVVIADQTVGPVYLGGYFNHEVLVWDAALTDLDQRKQAFDGTPISVGKLL